MSSNTLLIDALALSPAERILLVEEIWNSLAAVPEAVTVTESQKRELEARLQDYRENPDEGETWEQVRAAIQRET